MLLERPVVLTRLQGAADRAAKAAEGGGGPAEPGRAAGSSRQRGLQQLGKSSRDGAAVEEITRRPAVVGESYERHQEGPAQQEACRQQGPARSQMTGMTARGGGTRRRADDKVRRGRPSSELERKGMTRER